MYICVRVSQEDFFLWRHKKSRSYQTIFNLVYYLGKFSTECFHLFLPWQPLVFDCSYVVSYGHIIAQRKAMQNLFKVKYFLTEVTKQWPPSVTTPDTSVENWCLYYSQSFDGCFELPTALTGYWLATEVPYRWMRICVFNFHSNI